jgi:cytochrome P450
MAVEQIEAIEWPPPADARCPHELYARLREEAPVYRHVDASGRPLYLVSRWEDIAHVIQHPDIFRQDIYQLPEIAEQSAFVVPRFTGDGTVQRYEPRPTTHSDGPQHRIKRAWGLRLVQKGRMLEYAPVIRQICVDLIDGFAEQGRCEFRADFAEQLPAYLICKLLGLPEEHAPQFIEWSDATVLRTAIDRSPEHRAGPEHAWRAVHEYMREALLERLAEPRDDFLSELVHAQVEQDGDIDLNYQVVQAANLVFAGSETTAHMLVNAMWLLCQDPQRMQQVRSDSKLIRHALEESLRLETPVQYLMRLTSRATELGGVEIPERSIVVILLASGNRDPERFADPEEFDCARARVAKEQLAFGRGRHHCVGAPLARLEGQIAFEELFSRFAAIRIDEGAQGDGQEVDSTLMHSLRELHLTLTLA